MGLQPPKNMNVLLSILHKLLLASVPLTAVSGYAAPCPAEVTRGIDASGTDYYDAKRAACLPKEAKALQAAIYGAVSEKPERAWQLTHALLCGKGPEAEAAIRPRIMNPIKDVVVGHDKASDTVVHQHRKARDLMKNGCAFSPHVKALSRTELKVQYIPYSPQAYCGEAFILRLRKNDWLIAETSGACD
jgi:hypothetical protein